MRLVSETSDGHGWCQQTASHSRTTEPSVATMTFLFPKENYWGVPECAGSCFVGKSKPPQIHSKMCWSCLITQGLSFALPLEQLHFCIQIPLSGLACLTTPWPTPCRFYLLTFLLAPGPYYLL
jgi:hypothetical protein